MRGCLANQGDLDFEWNNFIGEQAINIFMLLEVTQLLTTSNIVIVSYEISVCCLRFARVITILKVHTILLVNIPLN